MFDDLFLTLGGVKDSWEYIIVGDPIDQLHTAVDNSQVLSLFPLFYCFPSFSSPLQSGEVCVSMKCWTFVDDVYLCEKRGTTGDRIILGLKNHEDRCPAPSLNEYLELFADGDSVKERQISRQAIASAENNPHFETSVRCFIQQVPYFLKILVEKVLSGQNSGFLQD